MIVLTHPTYGNIETACVSFIQQLDAKGIRPTKIVALSRGGLMLGVILSHNLSVPMIPVQYSSKAGKGDDKNHTNQLPIIHDEVILVVDDIADSGHSLDEVCSFYSTVEDGYDTNETGNTVYSAAMYLKEGSVHTPTVFWHELKKDGPFIHFPWERHLV